MIDDSYRSVAVTAKVSPENDHIVISFLDDPTFHISMLRGDDGDLDSFMVAKQTFSGEKHRFFPEDKSKATG